MKNAVFLQSYDEFIDLAEKGNNFTVDQSVKSLGHTDDDTVHSEASLLQNFKCEQVVFSFGHAVGKNIGKLVKQHFL